MKPLCNSYKDGIIKLPPDLATEIKNWLGEEIDKLQETINKLSTKKVYSPRNLEISGYTFEDIKFLENKIKEVESCFECLNKDNSHKATQSKIKIIFDFLLIKYGLQTRKYFVNNGLNIPEIEASKYRKIFETNFDDAVIDVCTANSDILPKDLHDKLYILEQIKEYL
jgi:hypothetical protein